MICAFLYLMIISLLNIVEAQRAVPIQFKERITLTLISSKKIKYCYQFFCIRNFIIIKLKMD